MTMIAMQESEKFPMLIGDLLFSSTFEKDFTYPSYNIKIDLPMDDGRHPYRMIQKTYIVHPCIAVVVAGNYQLILNFINAIKDYFKVHEATVANLDSFISTYAVSPLKEAYGICIANPHNLEFQYRYLGCWTEKKYSAVGKIRSAGSGASDFLQLCDNFNDEGFLLNVDTYRNAIANVCMLFSTVLGEERYFANDVKHAWGAGFEITVFDYSKKHFVKIDNINYIIWKSKFDISEQKLETEPLSVMTYKYIGEALSITSHHGTNPNMYIILPIYMNKSDFDQSQLPSIPFTDSDRICNIFQVEIIDKDIIQPFCVFMEENVKSQTVFLKYDKNHFEVYLQQGFNETLETIVKEWVANNMK